MYIAWSWKTTLIMSLILRGWYPPWNTRAPPPSGRKTATHMLVLDFLNMIWNSTSVCVLILITHLYFGIMIWNEWKVLEYFVVLFKTRLWKKETRMAVVGMITCKIGLIWCHVKTLYSGEYTQGFALNHWFDLCDSWKAIHKTWPPALSID